MSIPENPGSRLERYLDVIATGQGVKPANPQTRLERYLDVIAGNTVIAPYADNLTPYSEDSGSTQSNPFILEGTGTGNGEDVVDTGSFAQIKSKNGNTIVYNQLVDEDTETVTIPSGHIYYAVISGTASVGTSDGTAISVTGGTDVVIDLSRWFGSTAAVPNELAGDADLFARYWQGSLDYSEGELISADGEVLISRGRNAWDEDWIAVSDNQIGSRNFSPCIPGAPYYISCPSHTGSIYWVALDFYDIDQNQIGDHTWGANDVVYAPEGAVYFKVITNSGTYIYGNVYNNDITVSLYYSGESGYDQYYPYQILQVVDTGSEELRRAGSAFDTKVPGGDITRKIVNIPDLSELDTEWTYASGQERFYSDVIDGIKAPADDETQGNVLCSKYIGAAVNYMQPGYTDMAIGISSSGRIFIRDSSCDTVEELLDALAGVSVNYELAAPTPETGTNFEENVAIDDFGTLEWQITVVPQGCTIFYPYDYKAAIDTLLNMVNGVIGDIVTSAKVPDAPTTDGTYVLTATVSDGTVTYSWQST